MDSKGMLEIVKAVRTILHVLEGDEPLREGLKETPMRVARFYREFFDYSPGKMDTTFESVIVDQMVILKGIRVYSVCEHHLLPFWCDVSIGYLTDDYVVGVSKLARIAQKHAHRLQLQERLCRGIAKEVQEVSHQPNVAVIARGQHMCMMIRGIKTDATMVTSVTYGKFRELQATRNEFMQLIGIA